MLTRAMVRGMHARTVLRRMYMIRWHRRIINPLDVVIRSVPPIDMTSEQARKYHGSNQHGR